MGSHSRAPRKAAPLANPKPDAGEKLIASNPIARSNYAFEEFLEVGIVLTGTEAKSLRAQAPNLRDSFVEVRATSGRPVEAWLLNCHIGPYTHGNIWNHDPMRKRKLLMHRHQIEQLHDATTQKGLSAIPIRMYFKQGRAKIELGVGRGKKKYDKREDLKKRSADREMDQAMKRSNRIRTR